MGWNISVLKNTLRMSDEVAEELEVIASDKYQNIGYSNETGIEFDYDAMDEHAWREATSALDAEYDLTQQLLDEQEHHHARD